MPLSLHIHAIFGVRWYGIRYAMHNVMSMDEIEVVQPLVKGSSFFFLIERIDRNGYTHSFPSRPWNLFIIREKH